MRSQLVGPQQGVGVSERHVEFVFERFPPSEHAKRNGPCKKGWVEPYSLRINAGAIQECIAVTNGVDHWIRKENVG